MKTFAMLFISAMAMSPTLASATTLTDLAAIPGCNVSPQALHFCAGVATAKDNGFKLSDIIAVEYDGPAASTGCTWVDGFIYLKNNGGARKMIDLKCGPIAE